MSPTQDAQPADGRHSENGRAPVRPTVIYVMGAGHSGSSILGVALGNCAGVFYAGEVDEWLLKGGAGRWAGADVTATQFQLDEDTSAVLITLSVPSAR